MSLKGFSVLIEFCFADSFIPRQSRIDYIDIWGMTLDVLFAQHQLFKYPLAPGIRV